ncbi:MAG: hypothetical protein CMD27_04110 [Flavobacteriales bacterium]|nr:hypothetical protein [Flavobacteriales bacterium]|tara:strand:- start:1369 stop:2151 length:783 start_codon:yes stop_codon:yes gene_type:complete
MLKISAFITLIILNALVLHQVLISHKVIRKNYFTIGMFTLLSLPILYIENYWTIIIANFLLVLIINELMDLSRSNNTQKEIFNSSFLAGLMSVIHFSFGIYYLLIIFFLGYYKNNNLKNFITQNMGFLVPFIIVYSILFFIQPDHNFLNKNAILPSNAFYKHIASYTLMIFITILACIEIVYNFHKKKITSKKLFVIIGIIIILSLCPILIWNLRQFAYLAIIPITVCMTNYLIYAKHIRFRTFLVGLWIVLFLFEFLKI